MSIFTFGLLFSFVMAICGFFQLISLWWSLNLRQLHDQNLCVAALKVWIDEWCLPNQTFLTTRCTRMSSCMSSGLCFTVSAMVLKTGSIHWFSCSCYFYLKTYLLWVWLTLTNMFILKLENYDLISNLCEGICFFLT